MGIGVGFGAFAGAGESFLGAGLKSENAGAGAFLVGVGAGLEARVFFAGGSFFGACLLKKENDGAGAAFLGAGGGGTNFFAFAFWGSKKDDRLNVGRGVTFLLSGVDAFATFTFGAGGFGFNFSVGFVLGASLFSNNAAKLNVGLGWDAFDFREVSLVAGAVFGGCTFFVADAEISVLRSTGGFSFLFPKKEPNLTAGFDSLDSIVDF